jgi:mannose-6-phosphate isomerase-like protein (cupin superfamily)
METNQTLNDSKHDIRPWGQYWVLEDTNNHKVKHIEVNPGGRLSYQYHHHRSEIWTVVAGVATVTLEGEVNEYKKGEVVMIPLGAKHRVQNAGTELLELIEVQLGTYFGEDDIIRIEDDYERQ